MRSLPNKEKRPSPGLRERKKAKTHEAIQREALRLFKAQGYSETTIEQIAEAAEVSPSTFFRYFPTKEDVVLHDALDPLMVEAFRAQPPELNPLQAMRRAMRSVIIDLSPEELALEEERAFLIRTEPALRSKSLESLVGSLKMFVEIAAERTGRSPDDFEVRNAVGVVGGIALAVVFFRTEGDSLTDYFELMDAGLAHLEAGLPL